MNEQKKLMPKLRFPEFRGAEGFQKRAIGDVCKSFSGGTPSTSQKEYYGGSIPFIRSAEIDRIDTELFLTEEGLKNSAAKLVTKGDVLVALYGANSGDVALGKIDGAINQAILCLKSENSNAFIYQFLSHRQSWITSTYLQGGQGNLSGDIVKSIPLGFPSLAEQQKIADCLSSLEELIAAQARKVEVLKTHKKGLMQQLFPREGETQPRLRFPEFRDTGEWEVKKLEEIAPLQRGFDLPSQEIRPGHVPIVFSNGPKGFHAEGIAVGPGLVTGRSGTIGKLHFIESGPYWPHNTSLWVTSFKGHAPKFVYYLFDSIGFLRFASGSGVPTLNRNDAHSFESSVPPASAEQQRIADCLSSLDALSTAATEELDTLKTHKKALMQQLFPAAEALAA